MKKKDYALSPWTMNGETISTNESAKYSDGFFGFIYIIEDKLNNRRYIGKKDFFSSTRYKNKNKEVAESDWLYYTGSNDVLNAIIKQHGVGIIERRIISRFTTRKHLDFAEVEYMFTLGVLRDDRWYNTNIAGRWYRSSFSDLPETVDAEEVRDTMVDFGKELGLQL